MDNMNQKCLAYFQEEMRQYRIMLDGVLSIVQRIYRYIIDLLKEREE